MNIREWFGCNIQYDSSTNFNKSLDELLRLYVQAVTQYLKLDSMADAQNLLIKASATNLPRSRPCFLNGWNQRVFSQHNGLQL